MPNLSNASIKLNKYRLIRYIEEREGSNILRVPVPASYKLK